MDTGIVTSFVIGGLLLLSLLSMNLNVSRSSTSLTMRQITQQNIQSTAEILSHDVSKIGFEQFGTISDPIITAESTKLVFKSDINNSGADETVEWFFDTSMPVTSSPNPNDYTLYRKIDGAKTDIATGVTAFKITFQDKDLNAITVPVTDQSDRNKIRHIKIELTISSKEKLGKIKSSEGEYTRSFWTKTFSPINLK